METIYIVDRRRYNDRRNRAADSQGLNDAQGLNGGREDSERRSPQERRCESSGNVIVVADENELVSLLSTVDHTVPSEIFATLDENNNVYKVHVKFLDEKGTMH